MSRILFLLLGMILFSSFRTPGQSITNFLAAIKTPPVSGEVYGIVVGISSYRYIKPLSYADKDAELFADLLRSAAGGKIKEENLFLLKNEAANAGNFWSALSRIINKNLKKGDRVHIYFAGHGDGVKGLNEYYLLLADCQPANDGNNYLLSFSAIDMYKLKNRIGLLTAKGVEVILTLDACRTNELAGGYASQVFNSSIIQTKVGEISMLATGPGQVSIEDASFGRGHGLFTYNLVDALSGHADQDEGGNKDDITSLEEVNRWVSNKVKLMSGKFNVAQVPVFCCDEKNKTPVGIVDSSFSKSWQLLKGFNNSNGASPMKGVKAQRTTDGAADSNLLVLYNQFNTARKENRLWGDSSADSYYDEMADRFRNEQITEDARYTLASDFINFAQQKINLYLEGKDLLSVERMQEKGDSSRVPDFLSDEYDRIKKAVSEKWTITGLMVQKAGKLLSSEKDSSLLLQLKPRINFLLARGYLSRERENKLNFEQALQYAKESYLKDSTAAYTAECLGLVYAYQHSFNRGLGINSEDYELGTRYNRSDTAMKYFKKAIRLAPNWTSPYRSIGLKIFGQILSDSALFYMRKALALNPQDGTSCILVGDLYRQRIPDSAMHYYKLALSFSGKSSQSLIYRRMARTFLVTFARNSPHFKPDSVLAYSTLALAAADQNNEADRISRAEGYRDVYMSIAEVYRNLDRFDSAMHYYKKVITLFPSYDRAYLGIFQYYNEKRKPDSVFRYSKLLVQAAPQSKRGVAEIARYYDKKENSDSAIKYYQKCLALDWDKEYCRERLGYLLMKKDKNDTAPLAYFNETLAESPFAWRSYFNIACYYANNQNPDKAIEFVEKVLQRGMKNKNLLFTDPFLSSIREKEAFKNLVTKYFPNN